MPKETVKVLMTAARSKSELLSRSPLRRLEVREVPAVSPVARLVETDGRSA